jgi:uncharacterized membrane protein (DUF2068 family)
MRSIYPKKTTTMPERISKSPARISAYDRWLVVIGSLKLLEALLFLLLGVGVIRLMHQGLMDGLTHLVLALRFDPEGRVASLLLDKAALLSPNRLKEISIVVFAHASLDLLEGVGLILRKTWAEFVTLAVSAFFLPLEFYSLTKHVTWVRVAITLINVAVVAYLAFHLQMRYRAAKRRSSGEAGGA